MSGNSQKIFNIAILILLLMCLFKINTMNDELARLRNTMNSNYNTMQRSIDSIGSNVRSEMEKANNLLSDSGWSTGSLNIDDKTATLSCYVVPKVYNSKETAAAIIYNGEAVPMKLEQGRYTAEIKIPLFEQAMISNVQFSEKGTIRTQQLNWSIHPRYDMIPTAYMYYSGGTGHSYKGDTITRTYNGYVEMDFEHKGFTQSLKDAEIVMLINGEEVMRNNPVLEELHRDEYLSSYRTEMEQSIEVHEGDKIELYMIVTDENGWTYHGVLEDMTIGKKGEPIAEGLEAEADIYDADGNLLFEAYKY